jgi:glycosyltransferase involved in cell wall biosynthesis
MPKLTLAVFDPNITNNSPAGSCLLKMLKAASADYRLELFVARTDLQASEEIIIHKMPVPARPVFLESILFTALSILFNWRMSGKGKRITISTQGGFPFCDISYAHNCHKLLLTEFRAQITGGLLKRTARLINYAWSTAMEAIAFRRASMIVAPSKGLARELEAAYGPAVAAKLRLIPNPVDCGAFLPPSPRQRESCFTFAFCALGNFEWKGLGLVLRALATGIPARVRVIGGTESEIGLFRKLASDLGILDCVTFAGLQRDIRPHLWSADAFVFPSVHETFPLVCLQAAAAGLPLIATSLNGLERLLQHGVTGWQVERTVDSVRQAMNAALADKDKTAEMGREAQAVARQYDLSAFQQQWLELLSAFEEH